MPHERRHARELSKDEQQYIILVKDIPRACRWQELKDMTRMLGGEQSLKAEVFQTRDGPQVGHCTIKGKVAAQQVFDNFCQRGWNGLSVEVSLAVLEKPDILKPIIPMTRTAGMVQRPQTKALQEPVSSNAQSCFTKPPLAPVTHQQLPSGYAQPYAMVNNVPNIATVTGPHLCANRVGGYANMDVNITSYRSAPYSMEHAPTNSSAPLRSRGNSGSPTNSNPRNSNESSCVIFISGLPYSQSEHELSQLLRRYGSVKYVELHPDPRSPGKSKGSAKAVYATPAQAINAIHNLDGLQMGSRKISVKHAKDDSSSSSKPTHSRRESVRSNGTSNSTKSKSNRAGASVSVSGQSEKSTRNATTTGHSGPLVVNGATGSAGSRSSRDEPYESDESTDDSSDDDESDRSMDNRRAKRTTKQLGRLKLS